LRQEDRLPAGGDDEQDLGPERRLHVALPGEALLGQAARELVREIVLRPREAVE
jgi:hypothetical protein